MGVGEGSQRERKQGDGSRAKRSQPSTRQSHAYVTGEGGMDENVMISEMCIPTM